MTTAAVLTARDLAFEPLAHVYRLPDGRTVPSVTHILSAVGVSVDFDGIAAMSPRRAEQIEQRRQLGTAVHQDAHAFDDDDLDWDTVDPRVAPYLRAWATFREQTGLVPVTRERLVFHPTCFYAGTLDGIFHAPDGKRVLVDIKIGDPKDAGCQFQTAAYEAAYRLEHHEDGVDDRWGVQLVPDRTVPYLISPYRDWRDFPAFQAFAATYHHQADRRRTR